MRVAFYSHDSYGLGHLRRTLRVASALGREIPEIRGLIVTGSEWSRLFRLPAGMQVAPLLPMIKTGPQHYEPKRSGTTAVAALEIRRRQLVRALERFRPDLLVVDNVPCGLGGELLPVFERARRAGRPRCVLALRDIVDEGARIREEWHAAGAYAAIEEHYEEIWVFGNAETCDPRLEYAIPQSTASRLVFCGRIGNEELQRPEARRRSRTDLPTVLVTGGGGGDAAPMVDLYCRALRHAPERPHSDIVLGPDFPARPIPLPDDDSEAKASVSRFRADLPDAIAKADAVVSMAGYNTVGEILDAGTPAVLLPRVWPRKEQWLRARALADAGRVECLDPTHTTPEELWAAVERALAKPRHAVGVAEGGRVAARRTAELLGVADRVA